MKKVFFSLAVCFVFIYCSPGNEVFINETAIVFADSALAAKMVSSEDDYTENLSDYDMSICATNGKEVTKEEFLEHLAKNVMEWTKEEKEKFTAFAKQADSQMTKLKLNLPDKIVLIKTTSEEYGGVTVAYTRQNAIMFTKKILTQQSKPLYDIFLHEIFHVYSRLNTEKKQELYKIIGFRQESNVSLPDEWDKKRISNPDAPALNTYIDLTINNEKAIYTPLMYSNFPKYNPDKPGGLFQSVGFGLLKVEKQTGMFVPVFFDGNPVIINPGRTEDYWKQIGKNTNYIIHPEEIIASNFVLLVTEKDSLPNPEIIDAMREVILK